MDDLFNFSFGDSGAPDLFGDDGNFEGGGGFSDVFSQIAKFALTQSLGGKTSAPSPQRLANQFARQLFSGSNAPMSNSSYFTRSSGQSMAQLASLILRAQRRFL